MRYMALLFLTGMFLHAEGESLKRYEVVVPEHSAPRAVENELFFLQANGLWDTIFSQQEIVLQEDGSLQIRYEPFLPERFLAPLGACGGDVVLEPLLYSPPQLKPEETPSQELPLLLFPYPEERTQVSQQNQALEQAIYEQKMVEYISKRYDEDFRKRAYNWMSYIVWGVLLVGSVVLILWWLYTSPEVQKKIARWKKKREVQSIQLLLRKIFEKDVRADWPLLFQLLKTAFRPLTFPSQTISEVREVLWPVVPHDLLEELTNILNAEAYIPLKPVDREKFKKALRIAIMMLDHVLEDK